jgi:DNA helicase-2/ATP-dependent DNA helicase PcrA
MDLSKLNDAQREAVTADDGPVLLIAGAGTGKTRTLVHRVAWLLEKGVDPRSIVLLTFTRRAAFEMLDKVSFIAGPASRGVRGGTFHGFGQTELRRHAHLLGYTPAFTILDSPDSEQLIGQVRGALGFGGRGHQFPQRKTIHSAISKAINKSTSIESVLLDDWPDHAHHAPEIEQIAARYATVKKQRNVMDYDDLLTLLLRLLREFEATALKLSDRCRYILVDEYQDTNLVQGEIASRLSAMHDNLMVVGDEAQSIYAFRGSAVENILRFPEVHPNARLIKLEQNYRSVQPVLDLANGVLASAKEGFDKRLFTASPGGAKPILLTVDDEDEQATVVAKRIAEWREQGRPLKEIAVLFRSASHSNQLEVELRGRGIPFRKFGGIQFAQAAHVKDLAALVRLVANPKDGGSWERVLAWIEGIGEKTASEIAERAIAATPPGLDPQLYMGKKYRWALKDLADALAQAAAAGDPIGTVAEAYKFYRPFFDRFYEEDASTRLRDFDTLFALAQKATSLDDLVGNLTLDPPTAADDEVGPDDWVCLSTVHSAKGLEWDSVFILQLIDGGFPSFYALDDDGSIEEERRLFYVSVTRARRDLLLVRPLATRMRNTGVCSLLLEIPGFSGLVTRQSEAAPAPPEVDAAKARMSRFLDFYRKG